MEEVRTFGIEDQVSPVGCDAEAKQDEDSSQEKTLRAPISQSQHSIFYFEKADTAQRTNMPGLDEMDNALKRVISFRLMRDMIFGTSLFDDPSWDILLDLAAARLRRQSVTVSDACIASKVPHTTALRYIRQLEDAELIERHKDGTDRRRVFLQISKSGLEKVKELLCYA